MAKPVTKGAQIAVRLPLDVDQIVRTRAELHGETPAEYLARQITRSISPERTQPIVPSGPRPLLPPKGSCEHRSTRHDDAVGGRVCKHCGEILPA